MVGFLQLGLAPEQIDDATLSFGEWLPDLPEQDNPGAVEALNVIPGESGYIPFKKLVPQAGLVLDNSAKSALRLFDKSGTAVLYVGATDGVYIRVGSSLVQIFDASAILYGDFIWQFVQFGDFVVALYPEIAPQVGDVGGGLPMAPLGGSPPIATCGSRVGDFLVLGNLTDVDGYQPQRIRWSGFDNIEAPWITDPATQADFQDMPSEGGAVVAITGREFGSVFQERSISRMTYVGLPTVFDIETVEVERGAIAVGAVIDIGSVVLFIAEDGFFVWNGTNSTPIGDNKVNRYFRERLDWKKRHLIVSSVDHANGCVVWAFPTVGSEGVRSEVIFYSYRENKFSHVSVEVECLVNATEFGVSLDDLTGDLDTDYPVSFDDSSYSDGRSFLGAFDTNHTFGLFSGTNTAATLDTGESTGPNGRRVYVVSTRPIVDTTGPYCTVSTARRDQFAGEALVFDDPVSQEITGECPNMADARYMRFRVVIQEDADWRHARGVQVFRKLTGKV